MFDNSKLLFELENAIVETYNETGLKSLRSVDYTLNGRNIRSEYLKAINIRKKCQLDFNYIKCLDDLLFCSDELMYFTGNLYFYLPYINDPIEDAFPIEGEMLYPNNQNISGKRYNMFADVAYQTAYNYWDKIGDLLASFFPEKFKPNKIFFHSTVEAIFKDYKTLESIKWLNSFKELEYAELNQKRKQVVHYNTFDTTFKSEHLKNADDYSIISSLQNERKFLPEYFKNHINLCLKGFENTVTFIEGL